MKNQGRSRFLPMQEIFSKNYEILQEMRYAGYEAGHLV